MLEQGLSPVGNDPFGVAYQISYILDIYIVIQSSSKITVVE